MSVNVRLPDDLAALLAEEAARQSVTADELAARVLAEHIPARRKLGFVALGATNSGGTAAEAGSCSPRGSVADADRRHRRAARCRRSQRSRPHGLPGAAGGASRTARHDRARDRQDRMADRSAARGGGRGRALRVRGDRRDSRRTAVGSRLDSNRPRAPFTTPISTSSASIAASSLSPSDSAQAASAHWTDAISASSVLSTSPDSSCFRHSSPRPPTASFAGVHELASLGP